MHKVIAGWGLGYAGYSGRVLKIDKAFVCHAADSSTVAGQSLSVDFPGDFDKHLAHGDTVGRCQGNR